MNSQGICTTIEDYRSEPKQQQMKTNWSDNEIDWYPDVIKKIASALLRNP